MASKEYERLVDEAAWDVVGEFWHAASRTKEQDAREIARIIAERSSAEFEALLDALEAYYDECMRQDVRLGPINGDAEDLLRKHGRLP